MLHLESFMNIYLFMVFLFHSLLFCKCSAKQRIDSGLFLFQAEMKKKKEKKQSKKLKEKQGRNLKDLNFMDSSDEDFC